MKTAIDWAAKPAPWCWIGPSFRMDVERICAGRAPAPAPRQALDPAGLALMGRRVAAKLSQVALAKLARCSESTICNLENGWSSAAAATWAKIDAALDAAEQAREDHNAV